MKKRMKKRPSKEGFSNNTAIIMLLLLVIISILSIAFYLQILHDNVPKTVKGESVGEVSITIVKAPMEAEPQSDNLNNQPT